MSHNKILVQPVPGLCKYSVVLKLFYLLEFFRVCRESPKNSMSFPCSEKSLSIPGLWSCCVCGVGFFAADKHCSVLLLVEKQLNILSPRSTYNETVAVRWRDRKQSCLTTSGQRWESQLPCLVALKTFAMPAMHMTSTDLIVNLTLNSCFVCTAFSVYSFQTWLGERNDAWPVKTCLHYPRSLLSGTPLNVENCRNKAG